MCLLRYLMFAAIGVFIVNADEMKEMMKQLHDTCVAETNIDEELIVNANKGEIADDPKLKCYMSCILVQSGTMDEKGNVDVDAMLGMMKDEDRVKVEPKIRECSALDEADTCEKAMKMNLCYYKLEPDMYFLI